MTKEGVLCSEASCLLQQRHPPGSLVGFLPDLIWRDTSRSGTVTDRVQPSSSCQLRRCDCMKIASLIMSLGQQSSRAEIIAFAPPWTGRQAKAGCDDLLAQYLHFHTETLNNTFC